MILLDTHAIIWLLIAPEQLSRRAREAILRARLDEEPLACSTISLYEIAYASFKERLELHATREDFIAAVQKRIQLIPITAQIAICAGELPLPFHGDPADRIIAATAMVTESILITKDERICAYNLCKTVW